MIMRTIVVSVVLLAITFALVNCSNETTVLPSTTTVESIVVVDQNNKSVSSLPTGNSAIIKDNFANFVQHSNKLLDNQTADSGAARSINSVLHTPSSSSGLSAPVVISIVVVTCLVVIGAIFAALFVMRRRFDIFRLNPVESKGDVESGGDNVDGGAEKVEQSGDNVDGKGGDVDKVECEKVESKQVDVCDSGAVTVDVQQQGESVSTVVKEAEDKQQASPSSSSPLIESNEESKLIVPPPPQVVDSAELSQQQVVESVGDNQVTSSSSLIVNVLSEISESVASKLAAKSPAKQSADPEKQPLNESKE